MKLGTVRDRGSFFMCIDRVLTECDHFYLLVEKYIEKAPYRGIRNRPACL